MDLKGILLREGNQRSHSVIPSQEILKEANQEGWRAGEWLSGANAGEFDYKGGSQRNVLEQTVLCLDCGGSYINLYV